MRNNLIILKVIFILMIFSGCAKPQPRNESQEKIEHGSEDGRDDRNTSKQTYPRNQIDSLNAIIPQETHLFQLFKDGFKKFKIPIQPSVSENGLARGLFPEIFNGYKQKLMNPIDSFKYNSLSDTIFWTNEYICKGEAYNYFANGENNIRCEYIEPYDSTRWINDTNIFACEYIVIDGLDEERWNCYEKLKNGERDSLRILLSDLEKERDPGRSIFLGMMVIRDKRVVKIDTAHYGTLPPSHKGGENGSFFEIPDSIFELYCKKPR